MSDKPANEFEMKLGRLEEIVRKLESSDVGLDESVALFREGKTLSAQCELLVKDAEAAVSRLVNPLPEDAR